MQIIYQNIMLPVSTTDNDELAEEICKGSCKQLSDNCGKIIGCGADEFDVSKHCPITCGTGK